MNISSDKTKKFKLRLDGRDEDQVELVKRYQETKDPALFEEIYDQFKPVIDSKTNRSKGYLDYDEIHGALNERLLWCANNFKGDENASFTGFVLMYFNYDYKNVKNRRERDELGGFYYEFDSNKTKKKYVRKKLEDCNPIKLNKVLLSGEKNEVQIVEMVEGPQDNVYSKIDSQIDLIEAYKKYKISDREIKILEMTLNGENQQDIAKATNISQSRVSIILSNFKHKHPEFSAILKEYLLDRSKM